MLKFLPLIIVALIVGALTFFVTGYYNRGDKIDQLKADTTARGKQYVQVVKQADSVGKQNAVLSGAIGNIDSQFQEVKRSNNEQYRQLDWYIRQATREQKRDTVLLVTGGGKAIQAPDSIGGQPVVVVSGTQWDNITRDVLDGKAARKDLDDAIMKTALDSVRSVTTREMLLAGVEWNEMNKPFLANRNKWHRRHEAMRETIRKAFTAVK